MRGGAGTKAAHRSAAPSDRRHRRKPPQTAFSHLASRMPSATTNIATLLARTAQRWPRLPAVAFGTAVAARLRHACAARARDGGGHAATRGCWTGDRVVLVARNCAGLHRDALRVLDRRVSCACRSTTSCIATSSRTSSPTAARAGPLPTTTGQRRCRRPRRSSGWSSCTARSTLRSPRTAAACPIATGRMPTRPRGCSTRAAPRAVRRALRSPMATSSRWRSASCPTWRRIAPGDAILHPAPLSHGSGLYVIPHVARGAVNVVPASGGFDPDEIATLVRAFDRSLFFAAPTMVKRLVTAGSLAPDDLRARLKCIVYGGGPMYVSDCKEAFAQLGPRLAQIYGQGESPMTITAMDRALLAAAIHDGDDAPHRLRGLRAGGHRRARRRCGRRAVAARRDRRGAGARRPP